MAVLEVARGGLLRRGLGVESADVAVVSNVAADHLGDYGINTVPELIPAKFIVRRALDGDDPLILNADDKGVVEFSETLDQRINWFSLDPENPSLTGSLNNGGSACYLDRDWLVAAEGSDRRRVVPVAEIPAAMGGIVRYNISNALAAMCIATALGIDDAAIRKGLAAFRGDEHDNPGRGNWFEHQVDGGLIRILVDFAHNEHGMKALADAVRQVPAQRVILLMGQAGDRLDKDIIDLVKAACSIKLSQLLVVELPGYERGRKSFEVPELIKQEAVRSGIPENDIEIFPDPREATAQALSRAKPGDLLVLLALTQRSAALSLVHEFIGKSEGGHG
jgi:cyanophycin synthetase